MCRAYADWRLLYLMYCMCSWKCMLRLRLLWHTYDRLNVLHVSWWDSPFTVGRGVVVSGQFNQVGYGVTAFICYPDFWVSEYVSDLAYLQGNVCECDLYVNIHIAETIHITTTQLLKHNDPETTTQICTLLGVILQQNYFIFQEQIYQPDKGIAMGSPISDTIAEVFLQHLEHIYIIETKRILFYTRYIDDILIIYDTESTNHDYLTQYTNTMHTNLQFNPTLESNGYINFLDLTIIRRSTHIEIDIYRKPTTTDTTIHFTSITLMNTNWRPTDMT